MKSVVAGIISIINDPKSTVKDLQDVIQIDPPLTARILNMANSVYFNSRRRIGEITQAIIWIGFDSLKELALSQKVVEIFNDGKSIQDYNRLDLWKHSIAVALISKQIFKREFRMRGENIYAAGLLHDIGIIVLEQFAPKDLNAAIVLSSEKEISLDAAETQIIGFSHATIGRAICENWNFPEEFSAGIGRHHDPLIIDDENARFAATLFVADYLSAENNIGFSDLKYGDEALFRRCLKKLDITSTSLNLIVRDVMTELEEMGKKGLI